MVLANNELIIEVFHGLASVGTVECGFEVAGMAGASGRSVRQESIAAKEGSASFLLILNQWFLVFRV